jgi:peroxiredoxin (alkyl hydroperoxide reductase subunit C)
MNAITPTEAPALPRLNEPAPDFDALTTHGRKTLSDYRGKWLVLFSHPADFTPVCTTEFMAFARRADEFAAMNTELLGLSIDSHYAHIAWVRSIKASFGVDITFPIIADLDMAVATAYGMIQPGASDTQAVRATFVIDPEGVLRAMVYYPMTNGRFSRRDPPPSGRAADLGHPQGGDARELASRRRRDRADPADHRGRRGTDGRGLRHCRLVFLHPRALMSGPVRKDQP